jgi:hypothetical protein
MTSEVLIMLSTKNERLALLISTVIFSVFAIAQLWRAFANIPVEFGGQVVPVWVSLLAGLVSLAMAFWMGVLLKQRRPLI